MNVILHPAANLDERDYHGASSQPVSAFAKHLDVTKLKILNEAFPTGQLYARGTRRLRIKGFSSSNRALCGEFSKMFRSGQDKLANV